MKFVVTLLLSLVTSTIACSHYVSKMNRQVAGNGSIDDSGKDSEQNQAPQQFYPAKVFEDFWQTARINIYPRSLEEKHFTVEKHQELMSAARQSANLRELSMLINEFLSQINVSHTRFYTSADLEFYFFRSLFTTFDPRSPELWHLGAELNREDNGYRVRAVLDGYAADRAGLKRGDLIVSSGSSPFHPVDTLTASEGAELVLEVMRNDTRLRTKVKPNRSGIHQAYINATKK